MAAEQSPTPKEPSKSESESTSNSGTSGNSGDKTHEKNMGDSSESRTASRFSDVFRLTSSFRTRNRDEDSDNVGGNKGDTASSRVVERSQSVKQEQLGDGGTLRCRGNGEANGSVFVGVGYPRATIGGMLPGLGAAYNLSLHNASISASITNLGVGSGLFLDGSHVTLGWTNQPSKPGTYVGLSGYQKSVRIGVGEFGVEVTQTDKGFISVGVMFGGIIGVWGVESSIKEFSVGASMTSQTMLDYCFEDANSYMYLFK